jgi:hypothetical protein
MNRSEILKKMAEVAMESRQDQTHFNTAEPLIDFWGTLPEDSPIRIPLARALIGMIAASQEAKVREIVKSAFDKAGH